MGRLFWKLFAAFVMALALSGLLVAATLSVLMPGARGPALRAAFMADTAARMLQSTDADTVRTLLESWRDAADARPRVVGPDGRELLGREAGDGRGAGGRIIDVDVAGATWRVIEGRRMSGPPTRGGWRLPPPPFIEIVAGVLGALAFSAALAWYLSRPVRHLHRAFDALAKGRLDVRVAPLIGTRRDEIADLGRGFDRMAAQIEHLLQAQRTLLHDVSHELRSPLARMTAAIGLARQDPARGDAMFERVEREAARLDVLVGELLGLSRLEYDAGRSAPQNVDLRALLQQVADDARFEARAGGGDVELVAVAARVGGHAELLRRALDNVLRNAVKHAPAGRCVQVVLAAGAGTARIAVTDCGGGVAEAELERIFDPFFRTARGEAENGCGLGLAIARRAVEAHGGTIGASNAPGGGLRIDIVLPLAAH
jgi:two-component system, OmpR family, sensor kinase